MPDLSYTRKALQDLKRLDAARSDLPSLDTPRHPWDDAPAIKPRPIRSRSMRRNAEATR